LIFKNEKAHHRNTTGDTHRSGVVRAFHHLFLEHLMNLPITDLTPTNPLMQAEANVAIALQEWAQSNPTLASALDVVHALLCAVEKTPRWGVCHDYAHAVQINDALEHKLAEVQGWLEDQQQEKEGEEE
jgi:hypothetical protein